MGSGDENDNKWTNKMAVGEVDERTQEENVEEMKEESVLVFKK